MNISLGDSALNLAKWGAFGYFFDSIFRSGASSMVVLREAWRRGKSKTKQKTEIPKKRLKELSYSGIIKRYWQATEIDFKLFNTLGDLVHSSARVCS